jgi:AMMECR1 domain-containing protein
MVNILILIITVLFFQQNCIAKTILLPSLVRQTMQTYFEGAGESSIVTLTSNVPKEYKKPAGVFVTLSTHGKTRACWGSLQPTHANIVESTVYATINALKKDYRYKPIKANEWKDLKPQVTVIKEVEPIHTICGQNPLTEGLLVQAGNKSAVLLPGEVSDPYYQLVKCKLKAGIHKGEPYQLYSIKAAIYE